MAFSELETALNTRLETLVAVPQGLKVRRDNAPEPTERSAKWCESRVVPTSRTLVGLGSPTHRRYRTTGVFLIELNVPKGDATSVLKTLFDAISAAFLGTRLIEPMVTFDPAPYPGDIQLRGDSWAKRVVTVPFKFDEVV